MRIPKNLKALSKIATIDRTKNDGRVDGRISVYDEDFYYQAKIFDEPSQFGVNNGRISKLAICEGHRWNHLNIVFNFDRGFDEASGWGLHVATNIVNAVDGTNGSIDFTS